MVVSDGRSLGAWLKLVVMMGLGGLHQVVRE